MTRLLFLLLLLPGCIKERCQLELTIPITFTTPTPELVKSMEVHFYDGERIIGGDIYHGYDFKNGSFTWTYKFIGTTDLRMRWRVYSHNRQYVDYWTDLK